MPRRLPLQRLTLADATRLQRVRLRRIRGAPEFRRCQELGLLPGVVVTRLRSESGKVVVGFPEGHTTAIELAAAALIEVDTLPTRSSRGRSEGRWP